MGVEYCDYIQTNVAFAAITEHEFLSDFWNSGFVHTCCIIHSRLCMMYINAPYPNCTENVDSSVHMPELISHFPSG